MLGCALDKRPIRHTLHMMYDLKSLRPDLIDSSEKRVVLRSSNKISFKYDKLMV